MLDVRRRRFLAATGAALAAPLLSSCGPRDVSVRVGAALPFSGGLELFGEQARLGLDLAASEINAGGGILGRPVDVLYRDMQTDPSTAAERTRELIRRDDVTALVGPISSAARNAMAPIIGELETPLLYATNYEGADDNGGGCGRYLFFFNTVPNQDTGPLIPWLANNGYGNSYYMFGQNYVWPRNMFRTAREIVDRIGGTVLAEEYTPAGERDFTSVIRKIAESEAEILLFALPGADGVTFIRQAEEFGLLDRVRVAFLGFSETYLPAFGEGRGENMITGVPFVASDPEGGVRGFVERVRGVHGEDVSVSHYVFAHYNALMALRAGLERAGEISREAAVEGMAGLDLTVATGTVRIDADDHHTAMQMFVARTERGALRVVERLGVIDPAPGCIT